jgi:hypothetical protein
MSDPFAPDEMAQHRTMRHCPMCLQRKPCSCDTEAATIVPPEEALPDPELSPAVERLDQMSLPERWEERANLE